MVRDIFDWHADEGLSIRSIAIRLIEAGVPSPRGHQLWSTSTLDRLVRNEVYAGTLYYNRHVLLPAPERLARHAPGHRPIKQRRPEEEWIAVSVPAIVDADTWARSQARHGRNSQFSPRHVGAERFLLRYLVRCGECERARGASTRRSGSDLVGYYYCPATLPLHLREERLRCTQPSARADELDQLVWDEVARHLLNPDLVLKACTAARPDVAAPPARQLADLRAQHSRLLDAYQAGAISLADLEARRHPLEDRIGELDHASRAAEHRALTRADLKRSVDSFVKGVTDQLDTMTFADRQQLLRTVLDRVVLTDERVELLFNIPVLSTPKEGRSRTSRVSDRLRSPHQVGSPDPLRPG